MNKTIERYYLKLQPLTPIHVGSGEEIMPYEYIIDKSVNKYYRINLNKLLDSLSAEDRAEFVDMLSGDLVKLRASIKNFQWKEAAVYSGDTGPQFRSDYLDKIDNADNKLAVEEIINSKMRPYIPGSSIKGAFRTAYLHHFAENVKYDVTRHRRYGFFQVKNDKEAERIEKRTLKYHKIKGDPFQTVKFSDSSLNIDKTKVYKMYSVHTKKDKKIPFYREAIAGLITSNVEQSIFLELSIDKGRQNCKHKKNSIWHKISAEDLLESTRSFSEDLIEYELDYLTKNKAPREAAKTYESLKGIHSSLEDNESLIRFGKGCGFNSTTLNLTNQGRSGTPITRVLAEGKFPVGWAVFSLSKEKYDVSILNNKELKNKSKEIEEKRKKDRKKKKKEYPNLKAYVKDKYGKKTATKVARYKISKSKKKKEVYEKYKKEYEEFLNS